MTSGSLRLAKLACPNCGNEVWVDVPRVLSIVYVCGECGVSVEQSLVTGTVSVAEKPRVDEAD